MIEIVVIEGPDGAGKTNLIGQLSRKFPEMRIPQYEYDRAELQNKNPRGRWWEAIGKELFARDPPELHDRLFFSELVYSPIIRGVPSAFTEYERQLAFDTLALYRIPVIFCMPPLDVVMANIAKNDQMDGVAENIQSIYHAYLGFLTGPALNAVNWMVYDYTNCTPIKADEMLDRIRIHLHMRELRRAW